MIVVRQRDEKDCGVCALLSIIRHHKGNVPLEKIRLDAKTTNEGTTALNLILASQKYGFEAVGVKLNSIYDIKQFPAIAHMNLKKGYTHYVVIEKITKDKIVIMDPAKGKVVMKVNDFICEWSNVVLLFYPKQKIIVLKNEVTIFKLFTRVMKSEKGLVKIIIFVSFLLMLLSILLGYYFQILFSSITNGYSYKYLKIIVIIFLIFTIFKIILSFYRTYLENHLNKNIDCLLNSDFLSHLYNLPLNVITSRNAGEIISRVNDLTSIKNIITEIFMSSTLDLILVVIAVPLLINISKNLFFILFLIIILYFLIGLIFSKVIFKRAYQNISYEADFNNNLIEDIKMINSIKNLNVISPALKKLEYKLTNYLYDSYLLNIVINKEKTLKSIIYEIGFFIINTYGLYLLYKSKISLINIITFNTLLSLFLDPLKNIVDSIPKYCYMKATISKINDFLSLKKENLGNIEETYGYELRFKNLTYSYNKFESIIKNFNLVIPEGNFILLKGPSGSGKSTICNILNKYINDYDGNILLGAINIKDLSINTIRNNILYVNQNENIFSGTIRENIALDKKISEVDFQYICYLCKIDEIVKKRPLRYETFISPDENNLSGGERQRIILARALLNSFNILLLDEALSEVDMKLELSILKNMRKLYKDKTIIYISHKKYPKIFDNVINLGSSICHT
ncbi:MAG: ATP-binding cassette domain-containing protein [Firmicutes bacterium]|nr:ATP-binding cassette domain-containing protein [Bacillota bacterium]